MVVNVIEMSKGVLFAPLHSGEHCHTESLELIFGGSREIAGRRDEAQKADRGYEPTMRQA
jgi:hypothetical protein